MPLTPQVRGARCPVQQRLPQKPKELESVPTGLSKSAEQLDTDNESDSESAGFRPVVRGPLMCLYVVNKLSARFHAAVILECGAVRRACAPSKDIDDWH